MNDKEKITRLPIPGQVTAPTAELINLLKNGKAGDILPDEKMSEVCGRDTRAPGKGAANLRTAQKHVLKEYGIYWRRIRGANCIRCETEEGKIDAIGNYCHSIRRKSNYGLKIAETVKNDGLSQEQLLECHVRMAELGTISLLSQTNTHKKLLLRGITQSPNPAQLLEAFKSIT